jgi:hypothetical protein
MRNDSADDLNDSTLPTYIMKCTICYFKLDNTLIADLKKNRL